MKGFSSLTFLKKFSVGVFASVLVLHGGAFRGEAQVVLHDLNSTALINPTSQLGMYYWDVQNTPTTTQNQLNKQWFWYRIGGFSPESSIDTLVLTGITQPTAGNAIITYTLPGVFNLTVNYNLLGGAFASGTADITEQIRIDNISGAPLPFHFFQYSDFNMGGDGINDAVALNRNGFTLKFNQSDQLDGANIAEVTTTPNADHAEADYVPATLAKLNDGAPTVLDDSKTNVGFTNAPGDVAWAFEWDPTIAIGDSFIISKDKHMDVVFTPEPSVFALLPLSLGAWAYIKRRRQRD